MAPNKQCILKSYSSSHPIKAIDWGLQGIKVVPLSFKNETSPFYSQHSK